MYVCILDMIGNCTISSVSCPKVTTTVYALSMRRQLCTSSALWNWTLAASAPGPWWAMSTWKWRTRQLPSRLTGQTDVYKFRLTARPLNELYQLVLLLWALLVLLLLLFPGTPLKWTNGTIVPGTAWVKHMRYSKCHFTVCTTIERLTSSGMEKNEVSHAGVWDENHFKQYIEMCNKWSLFLLPYYDVFL